MEIVLAGGQRTRCARKAGILRKSDPGGRPRRRKQVLTDVVLETLSIIAYKQPVTKLEIEKIRGVKSDHAVNRLVEYNLVYEAGRHGRAGASGPVCHHGGIPAPVRRGRPQRICPTGSRSRRRRSKAEVEAGAAEEAGSSAKSTEQSRGRLKKKNDKTILTAVLFQDTITCVDLHSMCVFLR